MALVILGGLFTSTCFTLWMVPTLYARFGVDAVSESEDDDLRLPAPEFHRAF